MDAIAIIKRLADERRVRRVTQRCLGEAAGLTPAAISRIEAGKARPALDTVVRMADALGYDGLELVRRAGGA